ncbi:MAG: SDR family oxidoreductase [Deltaproteobacteria bacterium]|nr:MAG: SDR family oxidoreductase [Deltaproteobacteria bacterium]
MKNKVIVVGGFGLIGRAIVEKLKSQKLEPVVVDIKSDETLSEDPSFSWDVTNRESEQSLLDHFLPQASEITGWMKALYPRTPRYGTYSFLDDDDDDGIEHLAVHASAFYRACRVAVCVLKKSNGGSLVNFGSIYGPLGPDQRIYEGTRIHNPACYAMAKESIIGLTRYIATSFAKDNIRCNALCPGGVFDNHTEPFKSRYEQRVPMGRMATKEDVASSAAFLVSNESSYVTGQVLMVDGGLSAW